MRGVKRRGRYIANAYIILILFILYLPTFVVIAYSFNAQKDGLMWTGFTTRWYSELLENRQIREALENSLIVACLSCMAAAVVGTLGAVALSRARFKARGLLEASSSLPIMLPEMVMGLALMVAFSLLGVKNGYVKLVLSHTTFCIPYVLILVRARLAGLDPAYEEAARDLGASPMRALVTITVPLMAPAIFSGVLLAFAMSLDDFVISFFVSSPETTTYPVYVYGLLRIKIPPTINAMCTVMLGVSCLAVALSQLLRAKKQTGKAPVPTVSGQANQGR